MAATLKGSHSSWHSPQRHNLVQHTSLTIRQHGCQAQRAKLLPELRTALPLPLQPAKEACPLLLPRLLHFPRRAGAIAAWRCSSAVAAAAAVGGRHGGRVSGGAARRPMAAQELRAERRRCQWRA